MTNHRRLFALVFAAGWCMGAAGQSATSPNYIPGTTYQNFNPNYPKPNPFYFEGKIDWDKLNITVPANTWEYTQRGLHKQDDLGDIAGAMADYEQSLAANSLTGGTCQLVGASALVNGALPATMNPPPCMFTVRLRLAYLLRESDPARAISLYNEVLQIDPLRLGVNSMIGETYIVMAKAATTPAAAATAYQKAVPAFQAELALSPVTPQYTALTGDSANNAHVHWSLAEVYDALGRESDEISELQLYLQASQWHSDVYPWRIPLAQKRIQELQTPAAGRTRRTLPKLAKSQRRARARSGVGCMG